MKLRPSGRLQREPREPFRGEGTSKINIYNLKVPLVPSVPSILPRACERTKNYRIKFSSQKSPLLCKIEGTKGTEGTRDLQITFFRFPQWCKSSLRFPLLTVLEAFYE
jgi:hypothetical protein